MNKQTLFFSLLIMQAHLPALCMEKEEQKPLQLQSSEYVLNEIFSLAGKKILSIHINNQGGHTEEGRWVRKQYSNPCNGNYLTLCQKYNSDHKRSGLNPLSQYLSILDTNTNIDRPYDLVPEFENSNNGIAALHLLNSSTPVVAHNNKIHILKEQFALKNFLQNIFYMRSSYALGITKTLTPHINSTDIIKTINSSDDNLVAISEQGHIFSWPKDELTITHDSPQTTQCTKKFFSSGVYPADNIMCLGLEDGNIFIIPLNNLKNCRETVIFPNTNIAVNWITKSTNELLFACLDKDNYSYKSITANQIDQTAPINTINQKSWDQLSNYPIRELYIVDNNIIVATTNHDQNNIIATFNKTSEKMLESKKFYVGKLLQPEHNNFLVIFDTDNDLTKCSSYYPTTKTIKEKIQRIMHWAINEKLKILIYYGIPLAMLYYIAYIKIALKMLLPILEPTCSFLKTMQ